MKRRYQRSERYDGKNECENGDGGLVGTIGFHNAPHAKRTNANAQREFLMKANFAVPQCYRTPVAGSGKPNLTPRRSRTAASGSSRRCSPKLSIVQSQPPAKCGIPSLKAFEKICDPEGPQLADGSTK
jgi:hypothetical protein